MKRYFMAIIFLLASPLFPLKAGGVAFTLTGAPETIMQSGFLGMEYFPDEALTVIRSNDRYRFRAYMAAGDCTRIIQGESVTSVVTAYVVLSKGEKSEYDNGYAGISGVYYHSDGRLYALYHAEDQENMPPIPGRIPGFYCSVAVAVSGDNDGMALNKAGRIITSQKPREWEAYKGQADKGAGEPFCALSRDNKYLYAYYTEHSRVGSRGVQICMARCDITEGAPLPGRWFKFYKGSFSEPGLGGMDTPVMDAGPIDDSGALEPFVDYSPYLGKYIMLFGVDCWKEHSLAAPEKSGEYISYSDDGIHWEKPAMVIKDFAIPLIGKPVSWHAVVLWDDAQKRSGMLVWSYSPKWGHNSMGQVPHYMVGQRIKFKKMK